MQAEYVFQELWRGNDDNLPIGLHHGSLDAAQRKKVEAAMAAGKLRAVVATSTLDLGIDWGDIDLVIHIGAPKGASRLLQRIGRANHRLDEPSRALLVPGNRFEVLECRAALQAAEAGAQDAMLSRTGALDVLGPAHPWHGVPAHRSNRTRCLMKSAPALPFADLTRTQFDRVVDFVSTGGYALKAYERFAKLRHRTRRHDARLERQNRPAVPSERRHHRRYADAEGAADLRQARRKNQRVARRPRARRDRRIFRRADAAARNVRFRRRSFAL